MSAVCVSGQLPPPGAGREEQGPAASPPVGAADSAGRTRVERLVTSGTPTLDAGTRRAEHDGWIVGDDEQCVVTVPVHGDPATIGAGAPHLQERIDRGH